MINFLKGKIVKNAFNADIPIKKINYLCSANFKNANSSYVRIVICAENKF
jgi:hypothetical protein